MADDDESTCWICLAGAEEEDQGEVAHPQGRQPQQPDPPSSSMARPNAPLGSLLQVCACPRRVHASCCARWQLHSAGKSEERTCRFCGEAVRLDYRNVMRAAAGARRVAPYMRVSFGGRTHKVPVAPGAEGAAQFEREIRRLLRLPPQVDFDVIFHCRDVFSGDRLKLQGLCAYDAAVTCASLAPSSSKRKEAGEAGGAAAVGGNGGHNHNHQSNNPNHAHDPGSGSGSSSGSDYGGAPGGVRASVDEGSRRHHHQSHRASGLGGPCVGGGIGGGGSNSGSARRRAAHGVAAAAATAAVAASAAARRRVSFEDGDGGGAGRRSSSAAAVSLSSPSSRSSSGGRGSLVPRVVSKLWTRVWGGPGGPAGFMERAILSIGSS